VGAPPSVGGGAPFGGAHLQHRLRNRSAGAATGKMAVL
jgi:hypothetical protein